MALWSHLTDGEPGVAGVREAPSLGGQAEAVGRRPTSAQPTPRRVYTDIRQVLSHLTHPRFTFTQSEADADILYNFSHFKDYR